MIGIYAVFIIVLFPTCVFAWGPAVHILVSNSIINQALGAFAEIIRLYPLEFLWGCISADIILGKNLARWQEHPHNWEIIFEIFDGAETDIQRAFLLGYLSHLASDTVAHNFFIPEMMLRNFKGKGGIHMRLEGRADRSVPEEIWEIFKEVEKKARKEECNPLIENRLKGPIIPSVRANRAIYLRFIGFERGLFTKKIDGDLIAPYISLSKDAASNVIVNMEKSPFVKLDPTGSVPIEVASTLRKSVLRLRRKGILKEGDEMKFLKVLEDFQPRLPRSFKASPTR